MTLCEWGERYIDGIVSGRGHAIGECRAVDEPFAAGR